MVEPWVDFWLFEKHMRRGIAKVTTSMAAMANVSDRLIITAASKAYGPSLLALLGSLTLNWPQHPPVLVYDIGLDDATRAALARHKVDVKRVPPFCPHWRKHYTWKIWCWHDAPARNILWIDAGVAILQPLDEVFSVIAQQGYFVVPNGWPLSREASEAHCRACGVAPEFRDGRQTFTAAFVGFCTDGWMCTLLDEALRVALVEEYIAATTPDHRWEQALFSLLLYRYLAQVSCADPGLYHAEQSPRQTPQPKVWLHRRAICSRDRAHFAAHISTPGAPYLPGRSWWRWRLLRFRYTTRRWLGARHAAFLFEGVRD
jgi:hypothetical protein